jgi:hypothetical protein
MRDSKMVYKFIEQVTKSHLLTFRVVPLLLNFSTLGKKQFTSENGYYSGVSEIAGFQFF